MLLLAEAAPSLAEMMEHGYAPHHDLLSAGSGCCDGAGGRASVVAAQNCGGGERERGG